MSGAIRAAVYRRVSTTVQEEHGSSLVTQGERCRAYCAERGYTVVLDEADALSGATLDRPGLSRLREAAKAGEFDALVIYAVDRLSRDQNESGLLFHEFENKAGVVIESVTEDLAGPTGALYRGLAQMFAAMERIKIKERTSRGRAAKLGDGNLYTWTFDLYGYRTHRPTRDEYKGGAVAKRTVVESEAAVVREVYGLVASGVALRQIAARLNARGVPSPGSTRIRYEEGRTPRWGPTAVSNLVANPAYRGVTAAGRTRVVERLVPGKGKCKSQLVQDEATWQVLDTGGDLTPTIVTADEWSTANARLTANRGATTRNRRLPMLLRSRVVCGGCGGTMHADHAAREGRTSRYRCRSSNVAGGRHLPGDPMCPARSSVKQEEIDGWVWSEVADVLDNRAAVVAEIRRRLGADPGRNDREVDALRTRIATLERKRDSVMRRFTEAEGMPWSAIEGEWSRLDGDIRDATAALASVEGQARRDAGDAARLDGLDELARRLGPRLVEPDFETRVRVVEELGVVVRVDGPLQTVEWSLPLVDSGSAQLVDLTDVPDPDEGTRAAVLADELAEEHAAWRTDRVEDLHAAHPQLPSHAAVEEGGGHRSDVPFVTRSGA